MAKLSKRMRVIREKVDGTKEYSINEAIALLKELATAKFVESVDVAVNLGIDARKSDQNVRGATVLPHGTGRDIRVAVFTQGANAEAAKAAGADIVGFEDLADQIKGGMMDFDVVIATPDAMRIVGQLGQILGPRGLMPNPKVGTVTPDVARLLIAIIAIGAFLLILMPQHPDGHQPGRGAIGATGLADMVGQRGSGCFPIAAGNSNYRNFELFPVTNSYLLQCIERVLHQYHICPL